MSKVITDRVYSSSIEQSQQWWSYRSLMEIPGLDPVREHFNLFPGTRESCIELLKWDRVLVVKELLTPLCLPRDGSLLGIAPGGAREAYFGDSNYPILWGSRWVSLSHQSKHPKIYRQGFAKCAIDAGVPIIPIFTENIREATLCLSGRMNVGRGLWEYLYETTKMPLVPMYGLFPVKLRTHLGKPIYPTPGWFLLSRSFSELMWSQAWNLKRWSPWRQMQFKKWLTSINNCQEVSNEWVLTSLQKKPSWEAIWLCFLWHISQTANDSSLLNFLPGCVRPSERGGSNGWRIGTGQWA